MTRRARWIYKVCVGSAVVCGLASVPAAARTAEVRLSAQPLGQALSAVAHQTSTNILFAPEAVHGLRALALNGNFSGPGAVEHLLRESGLGFEVNPDDTILIRRKSDTGFDRRSPGAVVPLRLAQLLSAAEDPPTAESASAQLPEPAAEPTAEPTPPDDSRGLLGQDIIVTAQRREQNLQDVGISMTAFGGEQIERLGFQTAGDIAAQTPSAVVRHHFPSRGLLTNLFIRGVGTTDFNNSTEGTVAAYVDDFYLSSSSTIDFLLYDMARAEVLRGPQGTLFGRNATGGAFQFFTNRPVLGEFAGRVKVGIGSFESRVADGFLNLPIGDHAAFRFSATLDRNGATGDNIFPGKEDQGKADFRAMRGQLLIEPGDDWTILLKAELGRARGVLTGDHGQGYDLLDTLEGRGEVVAVPVDGFGYSPADDGPDKFSANGFNFAHNRVQHYAGRVEKEFGDVTLTSVTGYIKQTLDLTEDCDGTPTPFCNYDVDYKFRGFSQEVRLSGETGRLNWTLGGFYMDQKGAADVATPILVGLVAPPTLMALSLNVVNEQNLTSKALFGQLEYKITDQITLIGGLRYTNDIKDFEQIERLALVEFSGSPNFNSAEELRNFVDLGDAAPPNVFTRAVVGDLTRLDEKNIGVTAQVNWQPNDDTLLYASYRRGIKGGGFNNEIMPITLPASEIPYKNEVLNAYELGWKLSLGDGLAKVNGAIFYYDYKDYQANSFQDFGQFQQNADATLNGAELEVTLNPADGLELLAGAGYIESEIKNIRRPGGFVLDTEMGEAPRFSFNGLARYTFPIAPLHGDMTLQVDASYKGSRFMDSQAVEGTKLEGYWTVNTVVSFLPESDRWDLDFFVRNLFNKRIEVFKLEADNLAGTMNGQVLYNERRKAGVELTVRF